MILVLKKMGTGWFLFGRLNRMQNLIKFSESVTDNLNITGQLFSD